MFSRLLSAVFLLIVISGCHSPNTSSQAPDPIVCAGPNSGCLCSDSSTSGDVLIPAGGCGGTTYSGKIQYIPVLNAWGIVPDGETDYYSVTPSIDESLKVDQMGVYFAGTIASTAETCTAGQPFYPGACSNGQITIQYTYPQGDPVNCPTIAEAFPTSVVDGSGNAITSATMSISYAPEDGSSVQNLTEPEGVEFIPAGPGTYTIVVSAPGFTSQTITWEVVRSICWYELFGPTTITLSS